MTVEEQFEDRELLKLLDIHLEFSFDKEHWQPLVVNETKVQFNEVGQKIWVRAGGSNHQNAYGFSEFRQPVHFRPGSYVMQSGNYHLFKLTGKVAASGDITSLIDAACSRKDVPTNCYSCLFNQQIALVSSPKLPATQLAGGCYSYMMTGTSIVEAPILQNTGGFHSSHTYDSYEGLFWLCKDLKGTLTVLEEHILSVKAFSCMFETPQPLAHISTYAFPNMLSREAEMIVQMSVIPRESVVVIAKDKTFLYPDEFPL